MKSMKLRNFSCGSALILLILNLPIWHSHASSPSIVQAPGSASHPCGEGSISYIVKDQDGPELDQVQISAVSRSGIDLLTVTNFENGDTCLDKSIFDDPDLLCLLFCREGYHCGALLPKKELSQFGELKISLARRMI